MEKRTPHYLLQAIQQQMSSVAAMNLTLSSRLAIRAAGMAMVEALDLVQGLSRSDFYKSMTTHTNHRVWQDVYHAAWRGKSLYVKFQQAEEYFVVSFKEL